MFVKKTRMPNTVETLDLSSATSHVVSDLLQVLDAIEGEDLKQCWKLEKKLHFSR